MCYVEDNNSLGYYLLFDVPVVAYYLFFVYTFLRYGLKVMSHKPRLPLTVEPGADTENLLDKDELIGGKFYVINWFRLVTLASLQALLQHATLALVFLAHGCVYHSYLLCIGWYWRNRLGYGVHCHTPFCHHHRCCKSHWNEGIHSWKKYSYY